LLYILASGTCSCIYSDTDSYIVIPEPGQPASLWVTSNLDTLPDPVVTDSLMVTYEAGIENGELYYVEAVIEDIRIYDRLLEYNPDTVPGIYFLADSFWVRGSLPLDEGTCTLNLNFYFSSNTNSLGDLLGLEYDAYQRPYILTLEGGEK
jgi:hypothetical protein